MSKIEDIQPYISVIIDRDSGIPYPVVIDKHGITPNQFYRGVNEVFGSLDLIVEGAIRQELSAIKSDTKRQQELFNMGEESIQEQYDRIKSGS